MADEVVRVVRVSGRTDGMDTVAAALERVSAGYGKLNQATQTTERLDPTKAYMSWQRSLDPVGRSLQTIERAIGTVNRAFDTGRISSQQYTKDLAELDRQLNTIGTSAQRQQRSLESVVNKVLPQTRARQQNRSDAYSARQDEIDTQRYQQDRQEFGRSFRERVGVERAPATQSGATYSALAQAEAEADAVEKLRHEYEQLAKAQQGSNFKADLESRMGIGRSASAGGASYSALADQAKRQDEIDAARQAQQTQTSQDNINKLLGVNSGSTNSARASAAVFEEVAAAQGQMAREANDLLSKIDPLAHAQQVYNSEIERYNELARAGVISSEQLGKAQDVAKQKLDGIKRTYGGDKGANATKLAANQYTNLGYQLNDVVSGLAMGQSPGTIATQQGGQIYQSLASAQGGLKGGIQAVGSTLAGLTRYITPVTVGIGGITTAFVAAAYAAKRYSDGQREVSQAIAGIGQQSGATRDQINKIAISSADAGKVSVSSAREIASAFAHTGEIGPSMYAGLITSARDYAKVTGQEVPEASKELADAFADPIRGVDTLQGKLGSFNNSTIELVKRLQDSGDKLSAQNVLLDAMKGRLGDTTALTTSFGEAWNKLSNTVDKGADIIGHAIVRGFGGGTAEEQLEDAKKTLQSMQESRKGVLGSMFPQTADTRIAEQQKVVAAAQARIDKDAKDTADKQNAKRGQDLAAIIKGAVPDISSMSELDSKIANLNKGATDQAAKGTIDPKTLDQYKEAQERLTGARSTYLTQEDAARQSEALALLSIKARTAAEYEFIAAEQKRLELAGQNIKAADRQARIDAAAAAESARLVRERTDALRDTGYKAQSAGQLPFQAQATDLNNRYKEIFKRDQGNPQATALDQAANALDTYILRVNAVTVPLRDANRQITEQVANLNVQRDSFMLGAGPAAEMAAKQDLINKFARDGIDIMKSNADAVNAYAKRAGEAAAANENFARTSQNIVQGMDEVRSTTQSTFTGLFSAARQGQDLGKVLLNSLGKFADQGFDRMISKPLTESIFGFMGKPGGGAIGDMTSKAFGNVAGITTPMANITAGTVSVTGASIGSFGGTGSGTGLGIPKVETQSLPEISVKGDALPITTASFGGGATGSMGVYAQAIKDIESSGGNYGALGPLTKTGDRAYGAYQVMGANVPSWTKDALGKSMTPEEFLKDKGAQDAVFNKQFGGYVDQFGPTGAAQAWLGGPGSVGKLGRMDGNGTTVGAYGSQFDELVKKYSTDLPKAANDAGKSVQDLSTKLDDMPASTNDFTQSLTQLGGKLETASFGGGSGSGGFSFGSLFGGGGSGGDMGVAGIGETWSANGNIMTSRGPLPLNRYAMGGIATSPQVSVFGEGRGPEAYVPLPDGRSIPVSMKMPAMAANANGDAQSMPSQNVTLPPFQINQTIAANGDATVAKIAADASRNAVGAYHSHLEKNLPGMLDKSKKRFA
jgi:hypothetical protein